MIAAVTAMAVFAFLALESTNEARVALIGASARASRARLSAEADAGFALAEHGLAITDPAARWNASGDLRTVDFDGDVLTIGVENESGKIPLNLIQAPQAKTMFQLAGASPELADKLTAEFIAMREGPPRAGPGGPARGSPLTTIDQLALLEGMTPALYARIAPEVTLDAPTLSFDPVAARPLAKTVMAPDYQPSQGVSAPTPLQGRAFTIRVDVADGRGAQLRRSAIVEFTGAPSSPVVVRRLD